MKTVRGVHAAYKPFYERTPTEYLAQVTHDSAGRIITVELPGGSALALSADELRSMLNDIEGRKE